MSGPVGIVAGSGELPAAIAQLLRETGRDLFVARIADDNERDLEPFPGADFPLGAHDALVEGLRQAGCSEIMFLGNVARPDFSKLQIDEGGQRILPGLLAAAQQGDDAILKYMIGVFEAAGFTVLGGEDLYTPFLCPQGLLTTTAPDPRAQADLAKACDTARLIGRGDIGQGAVVCRGLVLAVEAQEGTDAMLRRVATLPARLTGTSETRAGVLVKVPKPDQDRRIDLPTIGLQTVRLAAAAGLAGIGLEAGGAIVLDRERLVVEADAAGLFVIGLPA